MLQEKYAIEIEKILSKYPPERKRSAVLPLLYIAQQEYGYCTPDAIREVAGIVGVEPTEVESVVGFYTLFYDKPIGKHVVQVCNDLPCALRGSEQFLDHAARSWAWISARSSTAARPPPMANSRSKRWCAWQPATKRR